MIRRHLLDRIHISHSLTDPFRLPNLKHLILIGHNFIIRQVQQANDDIIVSIQRFGALQRLQVPHLYRFIVRTTNQLVLARQLEVVDALRVAH